MRFDFEPLHDFVLLSTKRSGSTYLLDAVKELSHWCDDHSFVSRFPNDRNLSRKASRFCLYRFHGVRTLTENMRFLPEPIFYSFMKRVISQANKVIVNHRESAFFLTLSDIVRQKRKGRSDDDLRKMQIDPVLFHNFFCQQKLFLEFWNNWINTVVPADRRLNICYQDIRTDISGVIDQISEFLSIKITYMGTNFHATNYELIPNYWDLFHITKEDIVFER